MNTNWSYNTLALGKPSTKGMTTVTCNTNCKPLSHADPTYADLLSPRKNRDIVRSQLRIYILNMLGAPNIDLELDEQNIDFSIDQALMIMEEYAGAEHFSYYTFLSTPGKSVYELPPDVGFVRDVVYMDHPKFSFTAHDLDGSIPIEYYYPGGGAGMGGGFIDPLQPVWGRAGEWYQYKQYEKLYAKLSSNMGGWEFIGGYRHIKLYPIPRGSYQVGVHYMQKNKDWVQVNQAMQEGALTYAKEILGRIRSRFQTIPGAGGGITMDGQALIQEAKEERQKWMEDLIYKFGDIPHISWG